MSRLFLATIVALTLWTALGRQAAADTPASADCTLSPRYAAFQEAVGRRVIGDCRAPERSGPGGWSFQRTTHGVFYLDDPSSFVTFRGQGTTMTDGPGGVGSDVQIDGLSERSISRDPVRVRAGRALARALIRPTHLGDGWQSFDPPTRSVGADTPPCAPESGFVLLGAAESYFLHEETRRVAYHTLYAITVPADWTMRQDLERSLAACFERSQQIGDQTVQFESSFEPLAPLGDESFIVRVDWRIFETGETMVSRIGMVRYGGLLSSVSIQSMPDAPVDEARAANDLLKLVKTAHDRVQHAAWSLRP